MSGNRPDQWAGKPCAIGLLTVGAAARLNLPDLPRMAGAGLSRPVRDYRRGTSFFPRPAATPKITPSPSLLTTPSQSPQAHRDCKSASRGLAVEPGTLTDDSFRPLASAPELRSTSWQAHSANAQHQDGSKYFPADGPGFAARVDRAITEKVNTRYASPSPDKCDHSVFFFFRDPAVIGFLRSSRRLLGRRRIPLPAARLQSHAHRRTFRSGNEGRPVAVACPIVSRVSAHYVMHRSRVPALDWDGLDLARNFRSAASPVPPTGFSCLSGVALRHRILRQRGDRSMRSCFFAPLNKGCHCAAAGVGCPTTTKCGWFA